MADFIPGYRALVIVEGFCSGEAIAPTRRPGLSASCRDGVPVDEAGRLIHSVHSTCKDYVKASSVASGKRANLYCRYY